jgi:cyanophycin synthetase
MLMMNCALDGGTHQADHICYVTMNAPHHPLVREHVRIGGRAIVLEQGANGH